MPEIVRKYKEKSQIFIKDKFTEDGAGWLLLQQIIIAPMSLLTTVLLAKVLSITDYGYYKYVLSIYSIVAIFGMTGFYNIASLNVQRGQDDFFYLGFKYRKLLRWIPAIISFFIALYYFIRGNDFFGILFLITIFSHLFVDLYDFYTVGTMGKGDYKLNAKLAILNYFISFFPPIFVAYITHNLYYVFITLFLCQFLVRVFAFFYVKNKYKFNKNYSEEFLLEKDKDFKKESSSLSFNNALSVLNTNSSSVIVFNRLGAESIAIYSLALTFADFIYGIISAPMSKILFTLSKMSKNQDSDSDKRVYIKSLYLKYFPMALFGTLLSILVLPFVYKFLFAKYFFSYKYALVYSISILSIIFYPAYQYFFEKRNIKLLNMVQIFTLSINLVSLFFVSMYFGVWGAVILAIIMRFVNNLTFVTLLNKNN